MPRMEKGEGLEKFMVQEENSISESSGGFQSDWTLYLATSPSLPPTRDSSAHEQEEEEEEEDLSMLSDASSGPPHFCYCSNVEDECISSSPRLPVAAFAKNEGKKQQQRRNQEESSFLDETASSPVLCFSMAKDVNKVRVEDSMELSFGFSVNLLKESRQAGRKTALKKER